MQLKEMLHSGAFVRGLEAVTARGVLQGEANKVSGFAKEAMETGLFDFIGITDNPGGNPHLAPEAIGRPLLEKGYNVNIHVTCKDMNRNALESRAWRLASDGFTNVLALSGDYPVDGYHGVSRPVFDIDSVGLLKMYAEMAGGLEVALPGKATKAQLSKTSFLLSATVSPFKKCESEYLTQYWKMEKKIRAGAEFFILQVGYDARKWSELLMYARLSSISTPFMANIYLLTGGVAKIFSEGKIAGCVVSPELLTLAKKQAASPDKGKAFFIEFAARQMAIAQGLGFRGAYLGGVHNLKDAVAIREKAKSYSPDDWKSFFADMSFPQSDEFYLYDHDEAGYALPQVTGGYRRSKETSKSFFYKLRHMPPGYSLSLLMHHLVFVEASPLYAALRFLYGKIDGKKSWEKFFHVFEHGGKFCLYGCHDCGDCSLLENAYLCPENACSKNQRNGPCGGSYQGICEVGDKLCLWHRAYYRLKPSDREKEPFEGDITLTDAGLLNTSAWQNYFLKRDHTSKRG